MMIPKDTMTPKERMIAFGKGEPMDRIPCNPFLGQNNAPMFGYTTREYNLSATVMQDVSLKLFQTFRTDSLGVSPSLQTLPEALGAKLAFQDAGAPLVIAPGITDYDMLHDMEPADPHTSGRLPLFLEALDWLKDKVGDEVFLSSSISGPFTAALLLCGTERALRDMSRKPESIHAALELTTRSIMLYMDAAAAMGIGISFADPLCSNTILRPALYDIFARPYHERLVRHMKEAHGRTVGIHVCGKSKKIWKKAAETGFSLFSVDNIEDLEEICSEIGSSTTILGNVDPVEILLRGTVRDVYSASETCIKKSRNNKRGFILGSGCEIPPHTPKENIQALVDAARIFGRTHGEDAVG